MNFPGSKLTKWLWPVGVVATGVAAASIFVFQGCWHRRMSWPVRSQQVSYQVCLGCGIKRLFDEDTFRAYGPFSYDLDRLVEVQRQSARRALPTTANVLEHRPAS